MFTWLNGGGYLDAVFGQHSSQDLCPNLILKQPPNINIFRILE
jgi:hypothetical protein